MVSLLFVVDN